MDNSKQVKEAFEQAQAEAKAVREAKAIQQQNEARQVEAARNNKLEIKCSSCSGEYLLSKKNIARRGTAVKGVIQIGVVCPHCEHFAHSYFETPAMQKAQGQIYRTKFVWERSRNERAWKKLKAAQKKKQIAHDRAQARFAYLLPDAESSEEDENPLPATHNPEA